MSIINQTILKWLQNTPTFGEHLELEARFGFYKHNQEFVSGVDLSTFNRIISYFSTTGLKPIESNSIDYIHKDTRKTDSNGKTTWIRKKRLSNYDIENYGIRLSISNEEPIKPVNNFDRFNPDIREKTRTSFLIYQGQISIDLTKVVYKRKRGQTTDETTFEIEIEIVKGNNFTIFDKTILLMLTKVQDTFHIYTRAEYNVIVNYVNDTLSTKPTRYDKIGKPIIDHRPLVTARNIKHRDIVDGGILGNKDTGYAVTHKADGTRKLIIVHGSGIWMVMAPYSVACIYRRDGRDGIEGYDRVALNNSLNELIGFVLDGELVPKANQKDGAPNTKYWFLTFDCLATAKDGASIQQQPLLQRMTEGQVLADMFKDNGRLVITSKNYREIVSATDFFGIMNEMFREQKLLAYSQDGFMFIPTKTEYNPHSDRFDLITQRVATKHPDQMKWKPSDELTIDFLIDYKDQQLMGYVNQHGQPTLFSGSSRNPFNQYGRELLLENDPLLDRVSVGSIVEYGWDYDLEIMKAKKIRFDKTKPNKKDIAMSVWDDIHHPVTESLLCGKTLDLMRRYHNRIKSLLYNKVKGTTLLDIGSGRGGDVSKWSKYERVIAVEPNAEHIKILKKRIQENGMTSKVRIVQAEGQDTDVIEKVVREEFGDKGVDVVSFMLSLTFFWKSQESLEKLFETIDKTLAQDGSIIFLTMNGDFVKQCFEPAFNTGPVLNSLTLDDGSTLVYKPPELYINLTGTIVHEQKEWLVQLNDLLSRYFPIMIQQADSCLLLSDSEKLLSSMYTFGVLTRKKQVMNVEEEKPKENYVLNSAGPPVPVVKTLQPEPVAVNVKDKKERIKINSPKREKPIVMREQEVIEDEQVIEFDPGKKNLKPNQVEIVQCNGCNEEMVRIGAIGDGSCFFHAVLNGFYEPYQNEKSIVTKKRIVKALRRDLAEKLSEIAENGRTNYQNSVFPEFFRATLGKTIVDNAGNNINFSKQGIYDLLNSDKYVGNELYKYVADMIGIDIMVVQITTTGIRYIDNTFSITDRNVLVINGTTNHYETVGVKRNEYYQTMFIRTDDLIKV